MSLRRTGDEANIGEAGGKGGVRGPALLESVLELWVVRPRKSESGKDVSWSAPESSRSPAASLILRPSLPTSLSAVERRDDVGEGTRLEGAVGGDGAYGESVFGDMEEGSEGVDT